MTYRVYSPSYTSPPRQCGGYLFAGVYAVPAQHGRGAGGDPDAGERVGVHLVLLDEALPLLVHVDAAVLPVVDLVVPYYGVAVCANLHDVKIRNTFLLT